MEINRSEVELLSFIKKNIVIISLPLYLLLSLVQFLRSSTFSNYSDPPFATHLFIGCDLQFGECFVGSGNISDWLRVKLAEL